MRKVAFNGRFSGTPQPTGTQTASFLLFDAILRAPRDFEAVVFADSRFPGLAAWKDLPNLTFIEQPLQDWHRLWAHVWEQFKLPWLARRAGCEIIHHPMTTSPSWKNGMLSVVTLHDLNFYRRPQWYSKSFRLIYALCAVPGFHRADKVVTISKYVQSEAQEDFHLPDAKVQTIYNGVKRLPQGAPSAPGPYILCVGSLQPHKNLVRSIEAFLEVRKSFPDLELRIVGRPQAHFSGEARLPELLASEGVKLLGYLSEEQLGSAYAGAQVFCYPSLEEGFGMPMLEAMWLGAPVLTSNVSCLPEIAGPATMVDPYSVEALAGGLKQLLELSPADRAALIAKGTAWASKFTWRAAATDYIALYDKLK